MLETAQTLPDNVADLQAMVAARNADIQVRDILIEKLKHQLAGMRSHRFGASSETIDQLQLTLEDKEIAQAAECAETLFLPFSLCLIPCSCCQLFSLWGVCRPIF